MKILFLTENFPPETNAAATRVYERALYWLRDGHDVTVITSAPNFPEGRLFDGYRNRWRQVEDCDGIRVVRVKTFISRNEGVARRTLDFVSFMFSAVFFGLFERRPDVISATSPQFFAAVGGWLLSVIRQRPFVFELGDLWPASIVAVGAMKPSLPIRMVEKLELFLYRRSAAVAALTHAFRENLVHRGIDPAKIRVVRNGVDGARYGPRPRDAVLAEEWGLKGKFVVGYIGTHGLAHALENVLYAADLLRDEPDIVFLFAGAGAARERLMREAETMGLQNVVFMPMQPKENMPAIWSLCDVALVHLKNEPTFTEVIPSKIFEAMAMGLPLLFAAPGGEATEIVSSEQAGCVVPPENPKALADAVLDLRSDEAELGTLANNALAAAPRYSRERQAELMIEVFDAAAEGRQAGEP
ncbi:MAG: glycosyltransferase family 4 protein [Alphaproteobacteria bacterium]